MRQLVTVRTIAELRPIPDADVIECAMVDGWPVVVKKGEFQVGDRGVSFEIDSFLPASDERFSFLLKNKTTWNEKEGMRLRTVKLRGQVSQGLILPVAAFNEEILQAINTYQSVEEILGVEKYEPPIPTNLAGEVEGALPSYIRKTDEERVQNLPTVLTDYVADMFEVTIKLDGTSMTVFHKDGLTGVGGKNWWFKVTNENSLCQTAKRTGLLAFLENCGRNIAVQGELMGPSIQSNKEKLKAHTFFMFNVWDIDAYRYYSMSERMALFDEMRNNGVSIEHVPVLDTQFSLSQFNSIDDVVAFADGPSYNPTVKREGVVFKQVNGDFSFKAISNAWLLKYE